MKTPRRKVTPIAATPKTATALGFGMFGLGAEFTDPAAITFANRVRDELGVDIAESPYRYYQTDEIAGRINCSAAADMKILLWGTSLGCNNLTVVAAQVERPIDGMFGFQASQFGAKTPIPPNVQFYHLAFNPFIALGSYKHQLAEGNSTTVPLWTERWVVHPGDQDVITQNLFLDGMRRVLAG
jgi:hypothetical protein